MGRLVVNGYLKDQKGWGDGSVKCLPCKCDTPNLIPNTPFRKLGVVLHSQHWEGKVVASQPNLLDELQSSERLSH